MAIFTNTSFGLNDTAVSESYGSVLGGGTDALIESYDDELAVIEAMHAYDMAEIELAKKIKAIRESADEDEDEEIEDAEDEFKATAEGALGDIWEKIKAWVKKLWAKIKSFFKGIIVRLDAIFLKPKDFLKKYRAKLTSLKNVKVTITTYDYTKYASVVDDMIKTISDVTNDMDGMLAATKKDLYEYAKNSISSSGKNSTNSSYNTKMDELDATNEETRKEFCKSMTGSDDLDEFVDNLYARLRGKESKELEITNITPYIAIVDSADKVTKGMKKAGDAFDKSYANLNKAVDEIANTTMNKNTETGSKAAAMFRKQVNGYVSLQGYVNRAVSVVSSVSSEACSVAKRVFSTALTKKPA